MGKETVRICDVCKVRVSDEGETYYGGHPHNGWFTLNKTNGSSALRELNKKRQWDVCCKECLKNLSMHLEKYQ